MFIALSYCENRDMGGEMAIISFPFKGVAYGQKINWIKGVYQKKQHEFNFRVGDDYIVYLEKQKIDGDILWGKIIYYQNLVDLRVR